MSIHEKAVLEKIRTLLLPIPPDNEVQAVQIATSILSENGVSIETQSQYLENQIVDWRETGKPNSVLKKVIDEVLDKTGGPDARLFAKVYFSIHKTLTEKFDFDTSVTLLSYLRSIRSMAVEDRMSASKIVQAIKSRDRRLSQVSWKEIKTLLSKLRIRQELDLAKVQELFVEDREAEDQYFQDAALEEAADRLNFLASRYKSPEDIGQNLKELLINGVEGIKYLQILLFQCFVAEFFDQEVARIYEFNPRGQVQTWLESQWGGSISTGNAFLNNAKSVDILDENWVRSKKEASQPMAQALLRILSGLDYLGFPSRRELAALIRRWIIRYLVSLKSTVKTVPIIDDKTKLEVLRRIAEDETNTYGVLEQRTVDTLGQVLHDSSEWRSRGVGDAVNSNNLSKKKLGDCDYQNPSKLKIIAYEAHAGELNAIYVETHLKTLRRIYETRKEQLMTVADIDEWEIVVRFVAHSFNGTLPSQEVIDGHVIKLEYLTFADLLKRGVQQDRDRIEKNFDSFFLQVVNDMRTPQKVRDKLISYITHGKPSAG